MSTTNADVVVPVAPWYASKTVWLALVAAVAPLVSALTKGTWNIDPSTQDWIATIITAVFGTAAAGTRIIASSVTPQSVSRNRIVTLATAKRRK